MPDNTDTEISAGSYRKLSALMFTDMAGYSRLADKNEELAIELLEEHRAIIRNILKIFNGVEIDTAGDSFFAEFSSASDALNCAVAIQQQLKTRNDSVEPERLILVRIGLHIGDVVHMGKHVHGDGVNIAARLEPLALPGGICLSQDFYRAVFSKSVYPLRSMGRVLLKNISAPVEIYEVNLPWAEETKKRKLPGSPAKKKIILTPLILIAVLSALVYFLIIQGGTEERQRIAVLPFTNLNPDASDEYFADGLTEQMISVLSNISGFSVIARSSIMKYKNEKRDLSEIAEMLNVNTVLEGTIRRVEDQARVTVNLIDIASMENLWSKGYDSSLEDLLMVQADIANNVADELKIKLHLEEKEMLGRERKIDPEAYRHYLLGKFYLNKRSVEAFTSAIESFNKAIDLDTTYAEAYAGLADIYNLIGSAGFGSMSPEKAAALSHENVNKALSIDPGLADAHASLAYINFRILWNFQEAEREFKKAIELSPGNAQALEWYALFLALRGNFDKALELMNKAYELNPLSSSVMTGIGRIYYFRREYDRSIRQYEKTILMDPGYGEAYHSLGLTYLAKKDYRRAIDNIKKAVSLSEGRPILKANLGYVYGAAGQKDSALSIKKEFDLAAEKGYFPAYNYMLIYLGLNDINQAMHYFRKALEERYGLILYLKVEPLADPIRQNPEFKELLRSAGI